jgi:hypothetical protein
VVGFLAHVVAPVWRVVAPAMNMFAGVGRPLAKHQVMLANYVNRFLPGANPLWGLGVSITCCHCELLGNVYEYVLRILQAAVFYGWLNRG